MACAGGVRYVPCRASHFYEQALRSHALELSRGLGEGCVDLPYTLLVRRRLLRQWQFQTRSRKEDVCIGLFTSLDRKCVGIRY